VDLQSLHLVEVGADYDAFTGGECAAVEVDLAVGADGDAAGGSGELGAIVAEPRLKPMWSGPTPEFAWLMASRSEQCEELQSPSSASLAELTMTRPAGMTKRSARRNFGMEAWLVGMSVLSVAGDSVARSPYTLRS
jgi:hypothetical protein